QIHSQRIRQARSSQSLPSFESNSSLLSLRQAIKRLLRSGRIANYGGGTTRMACRARTTALNGTVWPNRRGAPIRKRSILGDGRIPIEAYRRRGLCRRVAGRQFER